MIKIIMWLCRVAYRLSLITDWVLITPDTESEWKFYKTTTHLVIKAKAPPKHNQASQLAEGV